jgi:hypothetical protein
MASKVSKETEQWSVTDACSFKRQWLKLHETAAKIDTKIETNLLFLCFFLPKPAQRFLEM